MGASPKRGNFPWLRYYDAKIQLNFLLVKFSAYFLRKKYFHAVKSGNFASGLLYP